MFENRAIKLINRQLSWLTGSLTCLRAFTRFYALLRAFISVKQFISLLRLQFTPLTIQGYTVLKFHPLSLDNRDPAASPLNARQYVFDCKSFFWGKDSVDIFEKHEIFWKNTIVWCIFELDGITKAEARFCV